MRISTVRPAACLSLLLLAAGCSTRQLPKYEKPIARAQFQSVRTTAYTHTEADHRAYSNRNALGSTLQAKGLRSAAADWSRWPAGTVFRLVDGGQPYIVDDYGWALAGTNTIDIYQPTRQAMNQWGVRRVDIEVLQWGDVDESRGILRPRRKYRHVARMLDEIGDRYAELKTPVPTAPVAEPVVLASAAPVSAAPLQPFNTGVPRPRRP